MGNDTLLMPERSKEKGEEVLWTIWYIANSVPGEISEYSVTISLLV